MNQIETIIKIAKNIVIISGAGLSKSSGIPTFREEDGTWAGSDPIEVSHKDADILKISLFYQSRFNDMQGIIPNAAHYACAKMETLRNVFHITQNIDGLLQKAGCKNVLEIHGTINEWCCTKCNSNLDLSTGFICKSCGSEKTRPKVILFGESSKSSDIMLIIDKIKNCDLLLTVGTSGVVQPVSLFPELCKTDKIPVIAINPSKPQNYCDIWLSGKAEEILPLIVEDLK